MSMNPVEINSTEFQKPLRPQTECISCGAPFMTMGERPPLTCCGDCKEALEAPKNEKPSWFMWYMKAEDRQKVLALIEKYWPSE